MSGRMKWMLEFVWFNQICKIITSGPTFSSFTSQQKNEYYYLFSISVINMIHFPNQRLQSLKKKDLSSLGMEVQIVLFFFFLFYQASH